MRNKYLNLLGLAYRAGKCSIGEETVVRDIQRQAAKLVLLAQDTGYQTKKKITDKCKSYDIPFVIVHEHRDQLSQAIGKRDRVVIAILDHGFATSIQSQLEYQ